MDNGNTFSFLHISDFHQGMKGSSNLWNQVKVKFHDDIRKHCEKHGVIDVVIFSGDLTQSGLAEEFKAVHEELTDLWDKFKSINQNPQLFVIPGNHDLKRPEIGTPILLAAKYWRTDPGVEDALFAKPESEYAKNLNTCFELYTTFISDLSKAGIPILCDMKGSMPGECSAVWTSNGTRVGFVGLNTAWSHLQAGDMKGKLEISHQQIHKAVPKLIDNWTSENDLNFLVTHHPLNWLSDDAQKEFNNEINPIGRFSAHLFGHMHESMTVTEHYGDPKAKKSIQVASLFGLEKVGPKNIDRRHGYCYAKICFESETITLWPKKAETRVGAGGWSIRPDSASLPEGQLESLCTPIAINQRPGKKKI